MANPGKPAEIKKLIGSRNYDANESVIELEQIIEIPEPLRRLEESGLALWERTWGMGQTWLYRNTDIELLQQVCEQIDERDSLRVYVIENMEAWHERAALRELEKAIRSGLSLLGFTPTDRMRLGVAEVKAQSKLEQMLAMRS